MFGNEVPVIIEPQSHPSPRQIDSVSPVRAGQQCSSPGCETLVLFDRFCNACFAEAAKALARRIEAEFSSAHPVARLFPGDDPCKAALLTEAKRRRLEWYEKESNLGEIRAGDAIRLRALTESACLLLAIGGEEALANLPGARRTANSPLRKKGTCDFFSLPQGFQLEPAPEPARYKNGLRRRELQYAAAVLGVMILILLGAAVIL